MSDPVGGREEWRAYEERGPVRIRYRNHRGETAWRNIVPQSIRFTATQWHPEPQWLLNAYDLDKQAERDFALADIQKWQELLDA